LSVANEHASRDHVAPASSFFMGAVYRAIPEERSHDG
jgi:hypothetical protein